ncbi:Inner membrane protein YohK [Terrisporobacter petrolearius]|uniref:LrgB family protein n=1 Tax=Terrisporobacter hibernicus TaxID=2813371 RepID=A0AAX2ZLP0_9FIRM|nr:LrgB family protein [Terrisporobacter hibernicus]UEL49272.1 LrgB family protein [Terrisporobacter hibernicus]UPA30761.1 LrgB family protein [Terrisporobacter glycolicus]SFJ52926.1 TIGR00659 family protein [Terrisporobacter glycolicus]
MEQILNTQLFGLVTILAFYNIGLFIQKKAKKPIFNGLLICIILIILFLKITNIPYESFKIGADIMNFMLGPVTVVLAVPLYRQFDLFKKHFKEILIGIVVGVVTSFIIITIIGKLTLTNNEIVYSILPKSITTPMGISLVNALGGVESITVVCIIATGIFGNILGDLVLKIGKIKHPVSKGIALGTAAHAMGTSKALEMGEVEGAMSSLSIGICGVLTVMLVPILMNFAG